VGSVVRSDVPNVANRRGNCGKTAVCAFAVTALPRPSTTFAKRLREAGFSEPQAEAVVATVQDASEAADLATKFDPAELRAELKAGISAIRPSEVVAPRGQGRSH
jgi:hypothetical protein